MNLNNKVKTLLIASLASVSAVGFLMGTATTVQARPDGLPERLVSRVVKDDAPPRRPTPEVRRPDPDRPVSSRSDRARPAPPAPERFVSERPPVPRR